jgi:hypothetical protein
MQSPKKTTNIKEALRSKAGLAVERPIEVSVEQEAVAAGRQPLGGRSDVAALRTKALELYGLPGGVPAIEAAFTFSPAESDDQLNYLHVEPLLERCGLLLERCVAQRSERDELEMERWKLRAELDRFFRLDPLEQRVREAGGDTAAYERAVLEAAAEQSLEENQRHAGEQLRDLTNDLVAGGLNRRIAARELAAWMSAWPLKDNDLRGDDANYTFDGARKTKPEHLFDAARQEADQDGWEQIYSLVSQRYTAAAESEAGRLRRASLELEAKVSLAWMALRREMAQAERDAIWEQIREAQRPGGVLNYNDRIAAKERDFSADFREALACLAAARRGLKEVYEFAPPFPEEGSAGYLDAVTSWVSRARNRLAQVAQNEQNYALAVSVKQLAGSQWEAGRAAAAWTFDVPDEMFPGQANVRLRGVSVSVVGPPAAAESPKAAKQAAAPRPGKAEGFWSGRLSVPATGTMRSVKGAVRSIDQKRVPACFLGRVTDRDAVPAPEIAGAGAVHNASPVGKEWKLTLSAKSTDGMETAELQDVQIWLHVAVH